MGKSELSCTFCVFCNLWFGLCGIYYYAHEQCIKDEEGAKSVKQRMIHYCIINLHIRLQSSFSRPV